MLIYCGIKYGLFLDKINEKNGSVVRAVGRSDHLWGI